MTTSGAVNQSLTTPPECFTSSPLTPPPTDPKPTAQVSEILEEIKSRREGHYSSTEPWVAFHLDAGGYKDLELLVRDDWFVQDKLRHDYFPSAQKFAFRMPTTIHEIFLDDVVTELKHQLSSIASTQSPSAEFVRDVRHLRSSTIKFDDDHYGRHDPDASFGHMKARYPGVVIEVSYSQKRKDVKRLADEYILGSNGNIRVVIGLNIEYSGKMVTISVWRPQFLINDDGDEELRTEQIVIDQTVRDDSGNPNADPQAGLRLRLEDFAIKKLFEPYESLADIVFIPAEDLCTYLNQAEELASIIKQGEAEEYSPRPGLKKRPQDITPPEQLAPERERIFEDDERRAFERDMLGDSSYKASSESSL